MPLLEVRNLTVGQKVSNTLPILKDISFHLSEGEILGILGESGSGKSLTALSIINLLPPELKIYQGEIFFEGVNLLSLSDKKLTDLRGKRFSIIFQDPLSSLNPVLTIYEQMQELVYYHLGLKNSEGKDLILQTLREVGVPDPELRLKNYPHELSGGLRQRVMIGMAILCSPRLLIADEPTTALDLTIQMQILELLKSLNKERRLSIIFITHDLGILRWFAQKILVFYQGRILESGTATQIFQNPLHPYTKLLFDSYPGKGSKKIFLQETPNLQEVSFCDYYGRCLNPCKKALEEVPPLIEVEPDHFVRCFNCA
ncbi:peptide ABC transporter ATP-binding protein [Caldimicrobium thiodismutans]|jgi:peptide/nickel transport system ATP-binding protein|uniref:Peptide ABC transporter ATP-binding protein n=1 Tax=Caldimicrobium thiodismutans TaxID=1653476 RepID=A0A0U5BZC6_9BACT|nr:ABC transporter ATP-binding protein [Caldimicrobium thiodismutans]BAU24181.1 peptide ABC transporter ATP-binding protein [Caldimicrobium thiodismutans]